MLYAAKISCTVYGTGWGAVGRSVVRGGARGSAPSPREGFFAIWTPLQLTFTRRPQQHADYRRACRDDRAPRSAREASGNLRPRGRVLRAARRAERRGPLRQPDGLEGAGCAQTRSDLPRIRPRASLRRRSLGARMRRHVLLENMGAVEMDVNLGRRDVGMSENLLDDAQIRTA